MQERAPRATRALPAAPRSPDAFAHAVLRTSKYQEMIDWYSTVLNARIVFRNDILCFLSFDEEHHRLAIANVPGLSPQDVANLRLMHLAYSYNDMGSLLATYRRLKQAGIVPYRSINHGMTVSLYYYDPDGTAIELQVDAFDTKEETQRFMESDAFRQNPIGVLIDPDAMLAAYEAGASEEQLKRRPDGPAAASQSQTRR